MATAGLIYNIQKFSLHDGPGIRTTVFFKGCPLSCRWCHNVESQFPGRQAVLNAERCVGCGTCAGHCPEQAIEIAEGAAHTDIDRCRLCGACLPECPRNSREICGESKSADEVIAELLKDRVFYQRSGGGVTFSGGEPISQLAFLVELLEACKEEGLHTAVDTSGYAPRKSFERILPLTDLFLYDLKLIDDDAHREVAGVTNRPILENLAYLAERGAELRIRIPVIPGINDAPDQLEGIRAFLRPLGCTRVHLLPFHRLGRGKAERFGQEWELDHLVEPSEDRMLKIKAQFDAAGFQTRLGG